MIKGYYKNSSGSYVEISKDSDVSSPVTTTHNGKNGTINKVLLYLKNDDVTKWYSNIVVTPRDLVDANPYGDVIYSETGWGVKLAEGGGQVTEAEWEDIDWGASISLDNIGSESAGDIATYVPFWYYISSPPNAPAETKLDIVLNVAYKENTVAVVV
jgi:hypothetical protein